MKAILMSIKPEWVAKILNKEKTIEVRKTAPKCDLPIDVYIYCTKGKKLLIDNREDHKTFFQSLNGKVVAKFTLNKVEEIKQGQTQGETMFDWYEGLRTETVDMFELLKLSCLTEYELKEYLDYLTKKAYYGYAWHISNLVIFDEPKELSEFWVRRNSYGFADNKAKETYKDTLIKAPQSWQFIEAEESL